MTWRNTRHVPASARPDARGHRRFAVDRDTGPHRVRRTGSPAAGLLSSHPRPCLAAAFKPRRLTTGLSRYTSHWTVRLERDRRRRGIPCDTELRARDSVTSFWRARLYADLG